METIRQLINDNKTDEALHLLDEYIKKNDSDDEAYYLRGNVYRKMANALWKIAAIPAYGMSSRMN